MIKIAKVLLSPTVFAIGFLWPLWATVLHRLAWFEAGEQTWLIAAIILIPFTLMAQFRGSWIWFKS